MNISDVAEASGLPAKTIRYYEEIGFVRPARGRNGYRDFGENDVHKLAFLARARSLGFSIHDCRALLSLYEDRGRASADVKAVAEHHLRRIDAKIAELDRKLSAQIAELDRKLSAQIAELDCERSREVAFCDHANSRWVIEVLLA